MLRWKAVRLYVALAFIVSIALVVQFRVAIDALHGISGPSLPIFLKADPLAPQLRIYEIAGANLLGNDNGSVVVTIAGKPVHGLAAIGDAVTSAAGRSSLCVTLKRARGAANFTLVRYQIPFVNIRRPQLPLAHRLLTLILIIALPAFCIGVGSWLVLVRSHDHGAWIVLALMLSFAAYLNPGVESWSPWVRDGTAIYNVLAGESLSLWLLILGNFFPNNTPLWPSSRAWRVLRRSLMVAILAKALARAAGFVGLLENYPMVFPLWRWLESHKTTPRLLDLSACLIFVLFIVVKHRHTTSQDGRRRLLLLVLGTVIGLGPVTSLMTVAEVKGVAIQQLVGPWIYIPAWLLFFVFPLALAYTIVVHRAMKPKVLVEEGVRYAAERCAVTASRWLLFTVCMFFFWKSWGMRYADSSLWATCIAVACLFAVMIDIPVSRGLSILIAKKEGNEGICDVQLLAMLRGTTPKDPDHLLASALRVITGTVHAAHASAFVKTRQQFTLHSKFAGGPSHTSLPPIPLAQNVAVPADGLVARALAAAEQPLLLYFDQPNTWVQNLDQGERTAIRAIGAEVLVPLKSGRGLLGFVALSPKQTEEPYSPRELRLLGAASMPLALALDNGFLVTTLSAEIAARERNNAEKNAADAANRAKSDFLAYMSHELRTPLNAIIGYSELLRDQALEEHWTNAAGDLTKIITAGRHLQKLVDSVLDLSKIEANKIELCVEKFPLMTVVEESIALLQPVFSERKNCLKREFTKDMGAMESDRTKVSQIITNLLSNAAKFTYEGKITVRVGSRVEPEGEWVDIEVEDTGIGIAPTKLEKLFTAYAQADSSISRNYGGTGLGLAISRRLSRAMGGDITVRSEIGRGSVFRLVLPRKTLAEVIQAVK